MKTGGGIDLCARGFRRLGDSFLKSLSNQCLIIKHAYMFRVSFLASLFLVSPTATWAQLSALTGLIRVSYNDADVIPNPEYDYYKTSNQLIFLDFEERSVNNYTWNSVTGRLTDSTFGEYIDYTPTSDSEGTYIWNGDTNDTGTYVLYDASWDLDYDGTPDGEQIDAGILPSYPHKLVLYKWVLYDQFNAGSLDTVNKWSTWFSPGGVAPVISAGRLELEVDPNASTSKNLVFESGDVLDVSGFTEPNTGLSFAAAPIIGVEADLILPAGVALESGVGVGSLSLSGDLVFAGIELANRPEGVKLDYEIGETDLGLTPAVLNETYRVRVINIYGRLRIYINGNEVADALQPEGFLGFTIFAFNDANQAMTATVDNVRVLVDPDLTVPAVLADADDDGLSNYDETNLYSTDPNNNDKFGDGFKDGELVLAGADPNVDYSPLFSLINSKLEDARVGSTMIDVTAGSAFLELQIERSTDLSTWSQDSEDRITVEIPLTDPIENGFFRFAFPQ